MFRVLLTVILKFDWSLFYVETKLVSTYRVQLATCSHWLIAAGVSLH